MFDLTFEELAEFGRRASDNAIRQAVEAGVPVATLAASNVTPIKAKRAAGWAIRTLLADLRRRLPPEGQSAAAATPHTSV